ncbi:hypothetical protein B0H67DRAFT_631112 [Lasiosphaeris hirsuta]|uniref:Chromo domain-containing protein n=1 Tax=Lasiosphaeris hirsuta TaxID=260670 RepID=A0AA40E8M4_9PEZI|nr:hypothetical protein B0H67DRAFT_631112 [Lasiosphaeris hirsuta]
MMANKNITTRHKTAIEIPLPSIKRYVPGSGPPPRISLAPPHDSTAYIINQFIIPPEKDTTAITRRVLHYHIGFTDIPAAKLLIPANRVLDYVSPRELEDWEYSFFEWREEEKARLALEKKSGSVVKGPGRPGAPSKKHLGTLTPAPIAAREDALILPKHIVGPSLSTPRKRKSERMLDDEDDEETSNMESDDAAIRRQLRREGESTGLEHDTDVDIDTDSVDQVFLSYSTSAVEDSSRASSSVPIPKEPPRQSIFSTSTLIRGNGTPVKTAPVPASSSISSAPIIPHLPWAQVVGLQRPSESPHSTTSQNGHISRGVSMPKPQPTLVPSIRQSTTPIPIPTVPAAYSGPALGSSASRRKQSSSKGQVEEKPKERKERKEKKAKHDKKQDKILDTTGPEDEDDEELPDNVWVVKELLDDQYSYENGARVHKYLVNWEGNWPPDQNPTWEPAENIQDDNLIAEYRRRKKAGLLKPDKSQKTLHSFVSRTPYANVAEAFEGEIGGHANHATGGVESDLDDSDGELRVIGGTRGKEPTKNGSFKSPKF